MHPAVLLAVLSLLVSSAGWAAAPAADDGTTPLHWAVYREDLQEVARLLRGGADVNARNDFGSTPLAEAAETGNVALLEQLLRAGADPDSANDDGQTALMILARTSNLPAARLLLGRGAHVDAVEQWHGQTALMWAAAEGQPDMVRLLLRQGANANARSRINDWKRYITAEPRRQERPSGGLTPLLFAARQGCVDCVRALLDKGASVDLTDPDGVTPLLVAVMNLHFDTARVLIERGANVDRWDFWGRSPLYAAVDMNTIPTGGRPDRPSLDDTTPFDIIRLLLERGANPNVRLKKFPPYRSRGADRGGDNVLTLDATPLLRAAKGGDAAAVRLLLAHGAQPDLPQATGVTPLMAVAKVGASRADTRGEYTTQAEAIEVIRLLAAAGADVNARALPQPGPGVAGALGGANAPASAPGPRAIDGAARWGWSEVVAALLALGSEPPAQAAAAGTVR